MPFFKSSKPYIKWSDRMRLEAAHLIPEEPKRKVGRPPKPARAPRTKRELVTSTCQQCNTEFTRLGRTGIFCSRSCQSRWNAKSNLIWERAVAAKMELDGWTMFTPSSCCDRIGIKDGQVFFVEFKPVGRTKLREFQKLVRDHVPHMYRVVVSPYGSPEDVEIVKVKEFGRQLDVNLDGKLT